MILFLFVLRRKQASTFMHEIPKPVVWENKKIFQNVVCEIFTLSMQNDKLQNKTKLLIN